MLGYLELRVYSVESLGLYGNGPPVRPVVVSNKQLGRQIENLEPGTSMISVFQRRGGELRCFISVPWLLIRHCGAENGLSYGPSEVAHAAF